MKDKELHVLNIMAADALGTVIGERMPVYMILT